MKKTFLLLGLGLVSVFAVKAQRVSVGPEIGINSTSFSERYNGVDVSDGMRAGFKVGGVIDIGITRHFALQPGLFYNMKGASEEYSTTVLEANGTVRTNEIRNDFRINYIEMPLNLEFKFGHRRGQFFFGGGPYAAAALNGTITNENGTSVVTPTGRVLASENNRKATARIGNAITDDIRPFDGGLNLNLGYESAMGLFVRGNLGFGLSNILPEGDPDNYIRNWGMGISVGYLFGHY
ncbi:MAG: PorT family protein [Bacteroidetes bacterium]|nr:PorT family protein [Bacteroidota bacterium]